MYLIFIEFINFYLIFSKVVITNEMTTDIVENTNGEIISSNCVPALGDSFLHKINQRIILNRHSSKKGLFIAKVIKSILRPKGIAEFWVFMNKYRYIL